MNLRQWLLLPLINILIALTISIAPAGATLLKDVRIGEYDKFTRIVFEFNSSIGPPRIEALEAGRLKIEFADTSPDLIRKIPLERSDRIRQIYIWVGKSELSAVLTFTFNHFRFESFQLSNPPRIALDIYRLTKSGPIATASAQTRGNAGVAKTHQNDALEKAVSSESATVPNTPAADKTSRMRPMSPGASVPDTSQTTATKAEPPSSAFVVQHPAETPNRPVAQSARPAEAISASQAEPELNSLQYYLVVALVVITIIILLLLLLMLFSRRRWIEDNKPIRVDEFLQRQDERIALLDARIQEQLKRYDDA